MAVGDFTPPCHSGELIFFPPALGKKMSKSGERHILLCGKELILKLLWIFFFFLISFASWLYSGLGRNCSGNASLGKHREKVKCGLLCAVLLVICTALLLHHSPGSA